MQGFYLKPKNNFTDLLHDPYVVGRGKERKGCLIQCSTFPKITCTVPTTSVLKKTILCSKLPIFRWF